MPQTSKLRNSSLRYDETAGYGSLEESKKGSNGFFVFFFFCWFIIFLATKIQTWATKKSNFAPKIRINEDNKPKLPEYAGTFVTNLEGKPVRGVNNDNVKHSNTQHIQANPIVVHGHRNNKQHTNTQHTQADTGAVHGQRRATVTVLYFALTSKS